jgi:diphthamide synthase (EF-2-diphthine--ammonia ligase)
LGFEAVITCVDSSYLDGSFVGRDYDQKFLSELPSTIDPCGEYGEFHTFAHNGPTFRQRIGYEKGEIVLRDNRFYYCDLLPAL